MPSIKRILLSRLKFIGDVVLTTPIVRAVRDHYPDAYLAYCGDAEAVSLLEHNPHLNDIIAFDFTKPRIIEQLRVIRELRRRKFDVFVDLFSNPRTALLAYLSGAPFRIGKEVKGRGKLYTHRIQDDERPKTAIEFHYQYVKPLGVEPTHWRTEIFLTDDEKREAKNYLKWQGVDLTKPVAGIHPSASWPAKMWQWERFADLITLIQSKLGAQVIITQGPKDKKLIENISQRVMGNVLILPVMKLRQLAAILSLLGIYISNDAAPMHIAVAVETKTIGVFGPGEENIWFPYLPPFYDASGKHVALRKDVPCHPCHLDFCNREGEGYMECMKLLSVEEVFGEVKKRLEVRGTSFEV
ncbi:MAG: glycosyltransferase family 9 protein [Ignavibacteriae bacterium]|nr:glycosyltransferase family 9 protein [Ignavibacteriota bacterium]